tara:strand:+ start:3110 stop:4375 length:1266 start_codon:yes stop_codon:yes gene_type:complete
MYFWYRVLAYLFFPFSPIYLYYRKFRKKEDLIRYREKLSQINRPRGNGFLIWIHVASVGEAMSVLSLIDNCIKEKKINKILLTSITLSSGKILEKKFRNDEKVIHQFLPLDIPVLTNKFLNHWKPNLSVFIDSEIWPTLILQTNKKKIPLILLNARITRKTFERWNLVKKFAKKIFEKFDLCIASNKESENFLKILGAKNIKNYGNLKFSISKNSSGQKLDSNLLSKIKERKIWCAVSTHDPEEKICATVHLEIKKKFDNILTIIIPRHIDRVKKINEELLNLNLKVVLSSKFNQVDDKTDVLLINSYGETLKFLDIAKYAFVGKSLIQSLAMDGGQNPIEPARLGCKILHGPNVSNFTEIYDNFKMLGIAKEIKSSDELCLSLIELFIENKPKNSENIKKIDNYGQNIFNNVILELKKYI